MYYRTIKSRNMKKHDINKMTPEEQAEELKKCQDSVAYFYNNYCRREGDPEYSEEEFRKYLERVQLARKKWRRINVRRCRNPEAAFIYELIRHGKAIQFPYTPKDASEMDALSNHPMCGILFKKNEQT